MISFSSVNYTRSMRLTSSSRLVNTESRNCYGIGSNGESEFLLLLLPKENLLNTLTVGIWDTVQSHMEIRIKITSYYYQAKNMHHFIIISHLFHQ